MNHASAASGIPLLKHALREYEVSELLGDGESPQYQLVCADQSHRRIVSEQEIRNAADTIRPPALLQRGEVHSPKRQKPMLTHRS